DPVGRDASTVAPDRGHSFRNMRALRPMRHSLATTAGGDSVGGAGATDDERSRKAHLATLQASMGGAHGGLRGHGGKSASAGPPGSIRKLHRARAVESGNPLRPKVAGGGRQSFLTGGLAA